MTGKMTTQMTPQMTQHNTKMPGGVDISGARALVTGANRGLGRAYVEELLERGAVRVYAAARNPDTLGITAVTDERVIPIRLDVTDPGQVQAAAARCTDVTVLINNAGTMLRSPLLAATNLSAARDEMETNYFGTLEMCRAFAPMLARNGGGAIVNVLSVASWLASPFNGSYSASKSAQWALTNAIRTELRPAGTLVVGVHPGWIDTDMAAEVPEAKISPEDVVTQTLDAVQGGDEEVLTDDATRHVKASLPTDQSSLYPALQQRWDAQDWPWKD
jgi:NAD(P)-dependent dehydrogenase (short-subunit alcohol dehydrogenase family)